MKVPLHVQADLKRGKPMEIKIGLTLDEATVVCAALRTLQTLSGHDLPGDSMDLLSDVDRKIMAATKNQLRVAPIENEPA